MIALVADVKRNGGKPDGLITLGYYPDTIVGLQRLYAKMLKIMVNPEKPAGRVRKVWTETVR